MKTIIITIINFSICTNLCIAEDLYLTQKDTFLIEYRDITTMFSIDTFDKEVSFILDKGIWEYNFQRYLCLPSYSFESLSTYLIPSIGSGKMYCDSLLPKYINMDFNEIVIRDQNANPQYYYIHIVRRGDLEDTLIHTWEGMSEEKVYLLNFDKSNMDSMVNKLSGYLEVIKNELRTNVNSMLSWNIANLAISPNPTKDNLEISFENTNNEEKQVEILNLQGLVLLQQKIHVSNVQGKILFDISKFSPGIYVCRLKVGNSAKVTKFLKW